MRDLQDPDEGRSAVSDEKDKRLAPLLAEVDEFHIIIGLKDKIGHLIDDAYDLGYGQGLEDAY